MFHLAKVSSAPQYESYVEETQFDDLDGTTNKKTKSN